MANQKTVGGKKVLVAKVKLLLTAGQATPAPPVGPALGQYGVNIMEFCKQFNERTKGMGDDRLPVEVEIYKDKSFTFIIKTPPTSFLIKKAAGLIKGSSVPNRDKVGKITKEQVAEIAKKKMGDLNTDSLESAMKMVIGTAKSMGITVEE
jgi:large subunit ribosomal protein L11|uniref:Large ribosomal subunit protein uL11 n=1 Tax=candidate division WOR-3 bacterium TaxID=2052148 RepID=A0A7C4YCE3_UNCW3